MSSSLLPMLVANTGYHVGHQMSIRVAEEQGFFQQEGFASYEYEWRGLVPGPFERDALDLVIKEQGVDIATAVKVESLLHQRVRGADLYIVGGWRYTPRTQLFGAKHLRELGQLRGGRIAIREIGGLGHGFIASGLRSAGVDPIGEVQWVCDADLAYGTSPNLAEMLQRGEVDAVLGHPPASEHLVREGYPLLLDAGHVYPGGRPGRVIVASGSIIERRAVELRAFLRANIRAFWFIRDPSNFDYLRDLEQRLRSATHNEDERKLRMVTSPEKLEGWVMPIDGGVSPVALQQVIAEMALTESPPQALTVDDVLRDEAVRDAYEELCRRPELGPAGRRAQEAAEKHGF